MELLYSFGGPDVKSNLVPRGMRLYLYINRIVHVYPYPGQEYTVEPPNKGHFGNGSFVLCSEVVPISEVQLYNPQI